MPEQIWFTEILNSFLPDGYRLLRAGWFSVNPQYPQAPIHSNAVAMQVMVFGFL